VNLWQFTSQNKKNKKGIVKKVNKINKVDSAQSQLALFSAVKNFLQKHKVFKTNL
jgi:hypothetical protein